MLVKLKTVGLGIERAEAFCLSNNMAFLLSICAIILIFKTPEPGNCLVKQAVFRVEKQRYLANHVIATKRADSELDCSMHCVEDGSCVSVNFKTSGIGKGRCELNDKTRKGTSDAETTHNPEFSHIIFQVSFMISIYRLIFGFLK
jgi:hypothetical protein